MQVELGSSDQFQLNLDLECGNSRIMLSWEEAAALGSCEGGPLQSSCEEHHTLAPYTNNAIDDQHNALAPCTNNAEVDRLRACTVQQGGLLGASVSIARVLLLGSCQDVAAVFIRSVVLRSGVLPLGGGAQRSSSAW